MWSGGVVKESGVKRVGRERGLSASAETTK